MCDFLIVKITLSAAEGPATRLSLSNKAYTKAVNRVAAARLGADEDAWQPPGPFFNPFGAKRDKTRGWRSAKYPSNGPSVTVPGPSWTQVVEITSSTRPRAIGLREGYIEALPDVVLGPGDHLPMLSDLATWLFRFDDLDTALGGNLTEQQLIKSCIDLLGLTDEEIAIMFQLL
jgi:hypothetical protein